MTIITGVKSPYILGKVDRAQEQVERAESMRTEFGIDIVK